MSGSGLSALKRVSGMVGAIVTGLLLVLGLSPGAIVHAAGPILPPAQPATGLGSTGPCGSTIEPHLNPTAPLEKITVYNPTGTAATSVTGGHCDDARRPVVVVVHGLLAGIDGEIIGPSLLYADLIRHFVSTGNTVIFATWPTNPYDVAGSAPREDAAIAATRAFAPRGDFSRLGIVGHSMGGGVAPYLAQRAVKRGWGSRALWLLQLAPAFPALVGTGKVDVPAHTRVVVENSDDDNILDTRLGIQHYDAYALPDSHKKHIFVRSDPHGGLLASHATHLSANTLLAPDDVVRFYGMYRVADALQSCSLLGRACDTDLGYMGEWSDGHAVRRSVVSNHPVDAGPPATAFAAFGLVGECESPGNPRRASCPPSRR